jgi:aminoglycoside phosphotransferase (APT) family kinase protein
MDFDEELPDGTLGRMVREIRPEWSVREAAPAAEGTDIVYFVTVETSAGSHECVLKICEFLDPEAFRPEPHLLGVVDRRTSIPVPSVVGAVDDHPDLPAPFFLMDRCDGEVRENDARDLPGDVMERVARDAGRNLAELHALGDFERFGAIRLAADADPNRADSATEDGIAVGDRRLTTDGTASGSWRDHVESLADGCLDDLHDRFADLEPDVRAFVDDHLDALDGAFSPVLGHDDYRLGNLLVDPESGETKAVLDWGNVHTLEPQYNLVVTEQYLSGLAPHDDPRRQRVRTALRDGYGEGAVPTHWDFERRRELYLAVTRLFPLVWFSLWYGHQSDSEREATADKHRRAVENLLE